MSQVLIKRGLLANLPASAPLGEPLFTTDTKQFFIGTGTGVALIADTIISATAPADTSKMWVDTANNVMKRYDGGSWVTLSAAAAAVAFADITGVPTDNTALAAALGAKADSTALTTEVTRAQAAEAVLTTDLAAEVTRATAAEATLTTNLTAEVTRATAAESALSTQIGLKANSADVYNKTETDDRIQAVVGAAPAALDTLAEIAAQLSDDENAVATLTNTVSTKADATALAAEVTRATAAEDTLTSDLADEITRATAAESALSDAIALKADASSIITYTASKGVTKVGNDFQLDASAAGDGLAFTDGVLSVDVIDGGTF